MRSGRVDRITVVAEGTETTENHVAATTAVAAETAVTTATAVIVVTAVTAAMRVEQARKRCMRPQGPHRKGHGISTQRVLGCGCVWYDEFRVEGY